MRQEQTVPPKLSSPKPTADRQLECGGVLGKIRELSRWLSDVKADVVAIQEAQLAGRPLSVPAFQTAAVSQRARGRMGRSEEEMSLFSSGTA